MAPNGISNVARLEALLDRGVLPEGFFQSESAALTTIGDAIAAYRRANAIKDFGVLRVIDARCGPIRLADLTYSWAEQWIAGLKRVHRLKPSTIRKHKGSLQRALNWVVARHPDCLPLNPL